MQREIKFRGKRVDGGGWVYGMLLYSHEGNPHTHNIYSYEFSK